MVNTITLSSDMQTLYIIDDGRAFEFPINTAKGIYVGTLKGQITAATALEPATEEGTEVKRGKTLKLTTTKSQWNLAFAKKLEALSVIGATDIDSSIIGATDIDSSLKSVGDYSEVPGKAYLFDLKRFILNVRRVGNSIEITTIEK